MSDAEPIDVVTGAFSYSGAQIAERLLGSGRAVRTLTHHPDREHALRASVEARQYRFDDPAELARSLRGATTLYNTFWVRFDHGKTSFANAIEKLTDAVLRRQTRGSSADRPHQHHQPVVGTRRCPTSAARPWSNMRSRSAACRTRSCDQPGSLAESAMSLSTTSPGSCGGCRRLRLPGDGTYPVQPRSRRRPRTDLHRGRPGDRRYRDRCSRTGNDAVPRSRGARPWRRQCTLSDPQAPAAGDAGRGQSTRPSRRRRRPHRR